MGIPIPKENPCLQNLSTMALVRMAINYEGNVATAAYRLLCRPGDWHATTLDLPKLKVESELRNARNNQASRRKNLGDAWKWIDSHIQQIDRGVRAKKPMPFNVKRAKTTLHALQVFRQHVVDPPMMQTLYPHVPAQERMRDAKQTIEELCGWLVEYISARDETFLNPGDVAT